MTITQAMILAAGRGMRMQPLTSTTPKPLINVAGKALIEYHILALAAAGVNKIVINVSHLGRKIMQYVGDGTAYGVEIVYSIEESPLGTAAGVRKALAHFNGQAFWLVSSDVWCDYNFVATAQILAHNSNAVSLRSPCLAHLLLVPNPAHNQAGDFCYESSGVLSPRSNELLAQQQFYTYSGIALLTPQLLQNFAHNSPHLGAVLRDASLAQQISGQLHHGTWMDIGTTARLATLRDYLAGQ